jgi:hypothetical protein
MSPTGELGTVPADKLAEAIAAGARVMTSEDMRQLRQEIFMEHSVFKDEHQRPQRKRKRRSIVRSGRR